MPARRIVARDRRDEQGFEVRSLRLSELRARTTDRAFLASLALHAPQSAALATALNNLQGKELTMGLMDQLGQAAGGLMGGQTAQNPLLQAVTSLLGQNSSVGGLAGLVQAFQKNGLGDIVNSWVSTGKNLPVTPDQIKQGLGGDFLSQLAGKAGVSTDAASSQLSSLLPDVIDKLTPSGKIEAGGIDNLLKMFQEKSEGNSRQVGKKMRP